MYITANYSDLTFYSTVDIKAASKNPDRVYRHLGRIDSNV